MWPALILATFCTVSNAGCIHNDKWTGSDKTQHLAIGATISFAATLQTKDPVQGFLWGAGVGILKEAVDNSGNGTCSAQDLAITALGAAIGAWGGQIVIRKGMVTYSREF